MLRGVSQGEMYAMHVCMCPLSSVRLSAWITDGGGTPWSHPIQKGYPGVSAVARPGASRPYYNAGFRKLARPSVTRLPLSPRIPKGRRPWGVARALANSVGHVRGSGVSLRFSALLGVTPRSLCVPRVFGGPGVAVPCGSLRFPAVPCGSLRFSVVLCVTPSLALLGVSPWSLCDPWRSWAMRQRGAHVFWPPRALPSARGNWPENA